MDLNFRCRLDTEQLRLWLLSFRGKVEVIEPAALPRDIASCLRAGARRKPTASLRQLSGDPLSHVWNIQTPGFSNLSSFQGLNSQGAAV